MSRAIQALLVVSVLAGCSGGDPVSSTEVAAVQITTQLGTLRPGETSIFNATAVNNIGAPISGAGAVTWASSATSVATVNAAGLVTALTAGVTSITATVQGVTGTRILTVLALGEGAVVTMPGESFIPFEATIHTGEQVFFEFPQTAHNVIFIRQAGAPQDIQQTRNVTIARTFLAAGQFPYDCSLHPGMSGTVRVLP